jgi:hypothetical protein
VACFSWGRNETFQVPELFRLLSQKALYKLVPGRANSGAGENQNIAKINGYFDFALADEDRTQPPSPVALLRALGRRVWTPAGMIVVVSLATGLYLVGRLRKNPNR